MFSIRHLLPIALIGCSSDKGIMAFNPPPSVEITSHVEGEEIYEGYVVSFRAAVGDPNNTVTDLSTTWFLNGEEICPDLPADDSGDSYCDFAVDRNDHKISIEVKDPNGATAYDSISVTAIPTQPPSISILSPSTESGLRYYSDQKISFTGTAADAEDEPQQLKVYWESDLATGIFLETIPETNGSFDGAAYLEPGEHYLRVTVEDQTGKTTSDNVTIFVGPPNSVPECAIITPENAGAIPVGQMIEFTGSATDSDVSNDLLSVKWYSDKDGLIGESTPTSNGELVFSYDDLSMNTHAITLQVEDEAGATCTDVISYTVAIPPTVNITSPSSNLTFDQGSLITFSAQVNDNEDLPENIAVEWSLADGTILSTDNADSTGSVNLSIDTLTSGQHVIKLTATDSHGLSSSDILSLNINGVPTQPTLSLSPSPAQSLDNISALASGSVDPEGSPVTYNYEWFVNGATAGITTPILDASNTSKGEVWKVVVTPTDGISDGIPVESSLQVINTTPTISNTAITPNTNVVTSTSLTCSATIFDPDETTTDTYTWTVNGQTIGSGTTINLTNSIVSPGDSVSCTIQSTDGSGATAQTQETIVVDNQPPSISSTAITSQTGFYADGTINCQSIYADNDNDNLTATYTWTNTTVGNIIGTDAVLTLTPLIAAPNDTIECQIAVNDGNGGTDYAVESIVVLNSDPTIDSLTITPTGAIYNGDTLQCLATASDLNGGIATMDYEWQINGNTVLSGTHITLNTVTHGDVVSCQVSATDGAGGSVIDVESVTIANTVPLIDTISLSPTNPTATDSIVCNATTTTDPDGDTVSLSYQWYVEGVLQNNTTNTLQTGFIVGQTVTCEATPNDGYDNGTSLSTSVVIENTTPQINAVSFSPNPVLTNDLLRATVQSTDVDGQTLSYQYDWYVDGVLVQSGSSNELDGAASYGFDTYFEKGQTVSLVVTPFDGMEYGNAYTSSSITVLNTPPQIDFIGIYPNQSINRSGQWLQCSATATDVDNETPSFGYEWLVNGISMGTGASFYLNNTNPNDVVSCQATATDSNGDTHVDSYSLTLSNNAPQITSVSLTPSPAKTNDNITCTPVGGSDADNDPITYQYAWYVDGVQQSTTTNTLSAPFGYGEVVKCEVQPYDGFDFGTTVDSTIIISNTLPEVTNVTLSPVSVWTNDTISVTAQGSDLDGQAVSYRYDWYVDGVMVQSGMSAQLDGSVVYGNGTMFEKGQFVHVLVTPNDGVNDGTPMTSSSITISNTAPTGITISSSPGLATTGLDDLVCSVTTAAADEDNDSLTYRYIWKDPNGVTQQTTTLDSLTDTFAAAGTNEGTWTCEVSAFDGESYGISSSTTVMVEDGCPIGGDGTEEECPSLDCAKILADGHSTGDGVYWIDPQADGTAYEVFCLMDSTYDGGGWTLISVHSDDGQDTWTWDSRRLLDINQATFGSLGTTNEDFKSTALHDVGVQDLLFIHAPSGIWAGYNDVDSGDVDFGNMIQNVEETHCYTDNPGHQMTSGTLYSDGNLCSTDLYFNAKDADGNQHCYSGDSNSDAYGPVWSTAQLQNGSQQPTGCPFNDPGMNGGLGMHSNHASGGSYGSHEEVPTIGFGSAKQLNTGSNGAAENYMQVFVRRDYTDLDGDGVVAWEDCNDNDASIITEENGTASYCPGVDCAQLLADGHSTGDGNYWIDPDGNGFPYEVYCLMDSSYDGGGWTLISVHSDDGQHTWTWNNRNYFTTNTATFGSLYTTNEDFKSTALHDVSMQDLLFVHAPSGIWAGYNDVDTNGVSFGEFMLNYQTPVIYSYGDGYPLTSGNLTAVNSLNETALYISAADQDNGGNDTFGPNWNSTFNNNTYFDDPANASLGPCGSLASTTIGLCSELEWNQFFSGSYTGVLGVGFGYAIGANTGEAGMAQNRMQVFVRQE